MAAALLRISLLTLGREVQQNELGSGYKWLPGARFLLTRPKLWPGGPEGGTPRYRLRVQGGEELKPKHH